MNKIIEHALIVLQKQDDWITKQEIKDEVDRLFHKANMTTVFNYLNRCANIGYVYNLGYRYYEPDSLSSSTQKCLERGEDW